MAKKIGNLSSLQWALSQTFHEPQAEDEFTAEQFAIAGKVALAQAGNRLAWMVSSGKLTKRKVLIDGRRRNVFRKA